MKKEQIGTVLSDKMTKTRVVRVERLVRHSRYKKTLRMRSKFYAHDEQNKSHVGDQVRIQGIRPMSKLKRWQVVEILKTKQP